MRSLLRRLRGLPRIFTTLGASPFNVDGPDRLMLQRAIEDHETRLDALNTSGTRTIGIPLTDLRVHDAIKDSLPDAAGADDMGLGDAPGSAALGVITADDQQQGYALVLFKMPADYIAGQNLTVRLRAKTTGLGQVANQFDLEAKLVGDAAVGSDICATAIQTVTAAYANYDFTITGTSLAPGDVLQLRIYYNMNDTGGGGVAGVATLAAVKVLYPAYLLNGAQ